MILVGLDFETANPQRDSACQLGVAVVERGVVVDRFVSYVRPPGEFHWRNVQVHGIREGDVRSAPTMAELWPKVQRFLGAGRTVVAHNAAFDRSVLVRSLEARGVEAPELPMTCTVALARAKLPSLPDHRLPTVCAALGVPLLHHHGALDDAMAAALVGWALLRPAARRRG